MSPCFSNDLNNASSLERKSSIERSMDLGATTASLVLNMYLEGQRDDNEAIMLSDLQVRHRRQLDFSFVLRSKSLMVTTAE